MKIFFSILILYIFISFLSLLFLITDSLTFYDKDTRERFNIKPHIKVGLAIYWPLLFYILYRCFKDSRKES